MRLGELGRAALEISGLLLAFGLVAAASAATAPALTPIRDPTQRLELPGLSILPPTGENWFIAPLPPKSDTPAVPLVGFVKRLGEKPPTRAADARMVSARVTVYDLHDPRMQAPAAFETATAFLDWLKQGAEKATGGMVTGRQRLIEHDATLDNSFGPTCARYRRVTELSGWGQFRESLFILTTRGWFCLHPHWPQYMIDAGYTQVHLKGEEPVLVDVEIEPFLRSPVFTSTRPMAQAPMSERADSQVATPSKADYVSYLKMVQNKIYSVWEYPAGISGTHVVTIRFVLDIDGKLISAEVVDSSDPRLNGSAIEAMNRASPFPQIPENLKKVAGEPLVVKFNIGMKRRAP